MRNNNNEQHFVHQALPESRYKPLGAVGRVIVRQIEPLEVDPRTH